ncbi:MAG: glucose-6-phosphate dehydrogenase [Verrucomicrobiae bacterium]|nr:glucose-6-phosphate dehydrogenase [Verrucomicrobiae bacterium]
MTDAFPSGPETCELSPAAAKVEPTAIVIFGATGDLTRRKIVPALYQLSRQGRLPDGCAIFGYARRPKRDDEFRADLLAALEEVPHIRPVSREAWEKLAARIYYVQGDLDDPSGYARLRDRLAAAPEAVHFGERVLFYLATAPGFFGTVAEQIARAGLAPKASGPGPRRLIVEKPFGEDLASARELSRALHRSFPEETLFRIDHYLGKETVQNLLYFRFGNSIYEPLWNRRYIDHVQITVAERLGVENRGEYYDATGAARDMLQNHLFQLLCLVAMEPPASLEAGAIHDEKVKVLRSIPTPASSELLACSVRAQYGADETGAHPVHAYLQEPRVKPDSLTETYVAWRLDVDNWRWSGVPFYLRTGKALAQQFTEIDIFFRPPPSVLFAAVCGMRLGRNCLRIRIQPNEGIHLLFNAKIPGLPVIQRASMHFHYREDFARYLPEAYERLLVDALTGESTLFTRHDEVEHAWRLVDALRAAWSEEKRGELPTYKPGSMGPAEAEELLARDGRRWQPFQYD